MRSLFRCVTSPPYWGLRSYLEEDHADKSCELGMETLHDCSGWATGNPCGECYVCHLVEVFRGVKRVLRDDGICWLNLGDTYWGGKGQSSQAWSTQNQNRKTLQKSQHQICGTGQTRPQDGKHEILKPKDLCMIPARVALALQADGWYLRSDVIWSKRAPMPESVTDRPTKSHEHIFLLSKSKKYFYDHVAVMEDSECCNKDSVSYRKNGKSDSRGTKEGMPAFGNNGFWQPTTKRNRRDVWQLKPRNFTGSHFATFPFELPEIAIKAGTSEKGCYPLCGACWVRVVEKGLTSHKSETATKYELGSASNRLALLRQKSRQEGREYKNNTKTTGWQPSCQCNAGDPVPCVVLDPFCGSGTSGVVALSLFRDFIGIELNREYIDKYILPRLTREAGRFKQSNLFLTS